MRFQSYIRTAIVVAIAASLSLSLTGCGDEDDQQVSGTAGSGSSLTGPDNGNGNDNQSEPVDTETDTDSSATSPTSCLVGTWLADNQQLGALFKSAAEGTDAAGAVSDPRGEVLITFGAEGQYSAAYDAWTMEVSQDGMTMELIREGTDTGSYEATDEGSVEWTDTEMGSTATLRGPTGSFEVPAGGQDQYVGTFTCGGEELEITADGATTAFSRQ